MVKPFDIQTDHIQLLNEMTALLNPNGTLFFSTNFRKFQLEWKVTPDFQLKDISDKTVPFDYRDKKIHRCYEITRLG